MECPRCSSGEIRAIATNGKLSDMVTRQRRCVQCKHVWYTVELPVSVAVIGWARTPDTKKSVPVLRVPVELAVGSQAV
jgi:transcriptional regulator NrdR family protein